MLVSAWQIVDAQDFPDGSLVKNPPAMQEMQESWVTSLGWEDTLEEEIATQSGILAWKSPWTEESGGLQSMASQKARHNCAYRHKKCVSQERTMTSQLRAGM